MQQMAEFPALTLWTDAYLSDTRHLSTLEHGAYLLLLMEAWRRPNCDLPGDDKILARLAGLSRDEWDEIKEAVMAFWKHDGRSKTWTQKRLILERDKARVRSKSQRDKAAKRWNIDKKDDAAALPEQCPEDASTATATAHKEEEPDGSPSSASAPEPAVKPARAKRRTSFNTELPADWEPTLTPRAQEMVARWPPGMFERELNKFRDHAAANGRTAKDWDAAFRTWIGNSDERLQQSGNRNRPAHWGGSAPDRRDGFTRALRNLPARLDDATMASLEVVASSPLPKAAPCDRAIFDRTLRVMDAALPRRQQGEVSGELLAKTYHRMLGHLTREAISFVAEEAIATCKWFPTVAECLEIAKRFTQPEHPFKAVRELARSKLNGERNARFHEAMAAIEAGEMSDEQIGTLPDRWKGMFAEMGLIWALTDGSYTRRPDDPDARKARVAELIEAGLM
jgi:uncharacterized protein YdaU (DUF1376 family)